MKSQKLRFQINIAILTTCIVMAIAFGAILFPFEMKRRESQLEKIRLLLSTIFEQRKDAIANDIFGGHRAALAKRLEKMRVQGVVAISIFDSNASRIASTEENAAESIPYSEQQAISQGHLFIRKNWQGRSVLAYVTPIRLDILESDVGYLGMYYDLTTIERETLIILVLFSVLLLTMFFLMASLLNFLLHRSVIRPVFILRDAINKVREGHLGEQVRGVYQDEIGRMILAFNDMSCQLEKNQTERDKALTIRDTYAAKLEKSNRELRDTEEKYRGIFENAVEGILQSTPEGRYISANPAMARILGYDSPDELIRSVSDIGEDVYVRPQDRETLIRILREHSSVSDFEVRISCKDRSVIWISLNARVVRSEKGDIRYFEGSFVDITARRRAERELRNYQAQLETYSHTLEQRVAERTAELQKKNAALKKEIRSREQADEKLRKAKESAEAANLAKSNFLASMSHELRTPMNAIIGMTDLALRTDLNSKQEEYLRTVRTSARSLLELLNDILDLSKIEAGKLDMVTTNFQLDDLLGKLSELFQYKAEEKGLEFSVELTEGVPFALTGDALRLRQILVNLVGNAVKFTEQGKVSVHVAWLEKSEDHVKLNFSVQDTGVGIPLHQIGNIFKSFTQADSSTTRKYGGSGLGLAICKRLAEMLGGDIRVTSVPGNGSLFYFTGNFGRQSRSGETADAREQTVPDESPPREHLRNAKILLVEDHVINQQVAKEILKNAGIPLIHIANNGREAFNAVTQFSYDAVLMDVQMPEMDGYEATRAIRHWESEQGGRGTQIPIIAMTAGAMKGDREKCLDAGMNDFLTKPIETEDLFSVLDTWIGNENLLKTK